MISGALRATANSSGVRLRACVQPTVEKVASRRTAPRALRMFDCLLGAFLTSEERAQQQDEDRDANSGIADVEYQKRPECAEVQVGEVDDIAVAHAVEDVAERTAEHHSERDLVEAVLFAPDPDSDADRDRARQRDQHPAAELGRRVEQAERDPVVLGVGEVEDRQQVDLPHLAQLQRAGDYPLRQLVQYEDEGGNCEAETIPSHSKPFCSGRPNRRLPSPRACSASSARTYGCRSSPPPVPRLP